MKNMKEKSMKNCLNYGRKRKTWKKNGRKIKPTKLWKGKK
jgi:hypothetical protein